MRVYTRSMEDDPCACATLRRATRSLSAAYDAALAPCGLRITQFSVLRTLARHGPLPITRLAEEAALDRSTMGRNLQPLQRKGLVAIEVGESDQRERVARLTEAGASAIARALPLWRRAQRRVAAAIDHAAIGAVAEQLGRVSAK